MSVEWAPWSWSSFAGRVMKDSRQGRTDLGRKPLGAWLVLATDGRRRQASRILDRVGWREKTLRAHCPCTLKQTLRRLVAPPEGHPATAQWKTVAARIHGANLYGQPAA